MLRKPLEILSDILFPPRCVGCATVIKDYGNLCHVCWGNIRFLNSNACRICSFPLEYIDEDSPLCAQCTAAPPIFNQSSSAIIYDEHSSKLITRFKYGDNTLVASYLAKLMVNANRANVDEVDYIIPVPIHKKRLLQRKFNQSALLAKQISKDCNAKFVPDMLKRTKHTPPQASLSAKKRKENVKGCFAINNKYADVIPGTSVLLVDDVVTTGSTLNECSKILKKEGVENIYILTLAKTVQL